MYFYAVYQLVFINALYIIQSIPNIYLQKSEMLSGIIKMYKHLLLKTLFRNYTNLSFIHDYEPVGHIIMATER